MIEKQKLKQSFFTWVIFAGILLLGSYLRFANLNRPSFWVDEMNHVVAAKSILQGHGPVLPSNFLYDRSILFTRIVSYSFAILGINELAARVASAIFGSLSIILVFFVGKRWFKGSIYGLTASLLFAFNPFMIGWARECRMYSMFQFLFILGVYALYEGLEGTQDSAHKKQNSESALQKFCSAWKLNPLWLAISIVALLLATSLHLLAGVLFPSIVVYALTMFFIAVFKANRVDTSYKKYLIILIATALVFAIGVLLFPAFFKEVRLTLAFSPNWANYRYVQNPLYYLNFLTSPFYRSIAIFFILGTAILLIRMDRNGLYVLINFLVPLALLSTFFSLRVSRYIYHIYPFMLLIAAYGLVWCARFIYPYIRRWFLQRATHTRISAPTLEKIYLLIFILGFLVLSPWFRFSRKIPYIISGTNGAVNHLEWKEAVGFVKQRFKKGEPIISTLPLTVQYYAGRVEYFLASLENPRPDEVFDSPTGKRDHFSNSLVIDTVKDIKKVMAKYPRGWLILDRYRLETQRYVRPEVMEFIRKELACVYKTPKQTIEVYVWE